MFKNCLRSVGIWGGFFILVLLLTPINGAGAVKMGATPPDSDKDEVQEIATDTVEVKKENIFLDKNTIAKGYTVSSFDNSLKLSLVPGILSQDTRVNSEIVPAEHMSLPWKLKRISPIYQFEFFNKKAYDDHKPFYIQVDYSEESPDYKRVFFYDKNHNKWRPLPTTDHPEDNFVRSLIHLPYARIAVFANSGVMTSGKASWYAYKGGNFTASPDFPKGSKLRVFNLENGKFVDVEVNDYGPERDLHPDRAVDLDKQAFAKIAGLGEGIIDVKVKPLHIAEPDETYTISGISEKSGNIDPVLKAGAGIIKNRDGEVLWSKNENQVLPLASLTKLVAIKTFLDQDIPLEKEVVYLNQDAEYNYEYCHPWESSHVDLKEGDVVTVKDLIFASLVGSANNSIETLVRASGLERSEFMARMNDYVSSLGAEKTHFREPTGLCSENVSTAEEYAIIIEDVLQESIIRQASTEKEYKLTTVNTDRSLVLRNTNSLLRHTDLDPADFRITGSKTGYIEQAGYCLAVDINNLKGDDFTILVMKAPTRKASFLQVEELIRYGLKKFNNLNM